MLKYEKKLKLKEAKRSELSKSPERQPSPEKPKPALAKEKE